MKEKEKIKTEQTKETEAKPKELEAETLDTLKDVLEEKNKETLEIQDKYLRLYAELENFKKVVSKEQTELLRYGHERLITEILPVIDNLERAINHSKGFIEKVDSEGVEALNSLTSGVEMTLKQIMDILGKFGVKSIKSS